MAKTIEEINEKIKAGKAVVFTAEEIIDVAREKGIEKTAKEVDEGVHVIIITGFASLETAMEAIKKGAYDYITKPFKLDEIRIVVHNACEKIRLLRQNAALLDNLKKVYQEMDVLKKSRDELDLRVEQINQKMDEGREKKLSRKLIRGNFIGVTQ